MFIASWVFPMPPFRLGVRDTAKLTLLNSIICGNAKKKTCCLRGWLPISASTRRCNRMFWQKRADIVMTPGLERELTGPIRCQRKTNLFALWLSRNSFRYYFVAADDSALGLLVHEFTKTPIHYRYSSVHAMLRREGWCDKHKPVFRLYCEQGLSLRPRRPRRNKSALRTPPQVQGLYSNHVWGMDFVSDALLDRRRLRLLTVIDFYTRWDLRAAESASDRCSLNAEQHSDQGSFTSLTENR